MEAAGSAEASKLPPWPRKGPRLQPLPETLDISRSLDHDSFANNSCVDLLECEKEKTGWRLRQGDTEINAIIKKFTSNGAAQTPRLLAFCVYLEAYDKGPFGYKSTLSRNCVERLFTAFDIHESFLPDMLGRPNYWSSVAKKDLGGKSAGSGYYEFFCQHPRWRWDDSRRLVGEGHRAPCTVYMKHLESHKLTVYIICTGKSDDWVDSLSQQMGLPLVDCFRTDLEYYALAESPFMLHALMAGVSLTHSMEWTKTLRGKLMAQLKQINAFAATFAITNNSKEGHDKLRVTTEFSKNLHLLSQYSDSGVANANMSIRLCRKLAEIFASATATNPTDMIHSVNETRDSIGYILDSFQCQLSWLMTYKNRKESAMAFLLNLITQQDSVANVDIAFKMSRDSSSMHSITILTMIFLPGTFVASIFSTQAFGVADSGSMKTTQLFLPMFVTGFLVTLATIIAWYYHDKYVPLFKRQWWSWRDVFRRRQVDNSGC